METAKVFVSGNSQAVRLPKEFRLSTDEVYIKKSGNSIVLFPKEQVFENFLKSINSFTDDFMSDGRGLQHPQERDWT